MPTKTLIQAPRPQWIPAYARLRGNDGVFELAVSRLATIASPRNALPLIAQIYSGQQCAYVGMTKHFSWRRLALQTLQSSL